MFDLEQSITEWRRQMLAAGINSPDLLDELESHLREDVAGQVRSGLCEQDAFEIAVRRIGQPGELQSEFKIAGATKEPRPQWLKKALLCFIGVRPPALHTFTASAQKTLELGGKEALGFHHDFIGTEHVLLGLLELDTGVVTSVLRKMGVEGKVVRSEIEKVVGNGPVQPVSSAPPYTPRVKKALELAGREAQAHNHKLVGPEHIFVGLLLEGSGVAALILKKLGVNVEAARKEIIKELRWNQSGA